MEIYTFWHFLADGEIHHFRLVVENGVSKYYFDGKLVHEISKQLGH